MPSPTAISSINLEATAEAVAAGVEARLPQMRSVAIALPTSHVITKKWSCQQGLREQETGTAG